MNLPSVVTPEMVQALSLAKIGIMTKPDSVFFATICMALEHKWDWDIPTARTDGLSVSYNPDFFMALTKNERIGLVLHEILHVAFFHVSRGDNFTPYRWNMACDYVINLIIIRAGFTLPDGGLVNRKYSGMAAEEVYPLMPEEDEAAAIGTMQDLGDPAADTENLSVQHQIDDILVQAAMQSKQQNNAAGTIPGQLERYVDRLLKPIVPWYRVLKNHMSQRAKSGYSYTRINRRAPDTLLPSRYSVELCDIAFAVDSSGSVTEEEFSHYISESIHVLKTLKPKIMKFLQFDTEIKSVDNLKTLRDFKKITFTGRGGTKIDPVMEWAAREKPAVLIIFTDGCFKQPSINPKVPTVWVIDNNPEFTAPFGKVIHFNFSSLQA